jgi:hypothetical protein
MFDLAKTPADFNQIPTFFLLISDGYPMKKSNANFQDAHYKEVARFLREAIAVFSPSAKSKQETTAARALINATDQLLMCWLMSEPIKCSLSRARGDTAKRWDLTMGLQRFLKIARDSVTLLPLLRRMLTGGVYADRWVVENMIPLMMII